MRTADPDVLADNLIRMARTGRSLPPSWDGAKIAQPVAGPGGEYIGKMLPGRGLYVDLDLKQLGITKQLPNVYERTRLRRIMDHREAMSRFAPFDWRDFVTDERGAITTYDGIINARAQGKAEDRTFVKGSLTTTASNWYTLFRATGQPAAGVFNSATPPTDTAPDRSTLGALSVGLSNPTSPDKKYLLTLGYTAAQSINMAVLADLLTQAGSFRLSVATAETIAAPTAVSRAYGANGAGNLITFVVTTAGTPAANTFTVTYKNQAASNVTSVVTLTATALIADQLLCNLNFGLFHPLASGDYGVQNVSQTQCGAAGTGVVACNVFFPLAWVPGIAANVYIERDSTIQIDGLVELVQAASVIGCLNLYVNTGAATSGVFTGFMRTCAG